LEGTSTLVWWERKLHDAGASLTTSKTNVEEGSQLEDIQHKFLNFKILS
jgi:hypothetical protein